MIDERREAQRRHPATPSAPRQSFAHPSEAILAALLDRYGIAWVYEPVAFPLAWHPDGRQSMAFRPDFYLPERRHFLELTTADQRLVTRKNAKVRRFRALYPEFGITVVYQRDFRQLCEQNGLRFDASIAA